MTIRCTVGLESAAKSLHSQGDAYEERGLREFRFW